MKKNLFGSDIITSHALYTMGFKQRCVVLGCKPKAKSKTHTFPKDECRGGMWVDAVRNPHLYEILYSEIRKRQYGVCHRHFTPDSWFKTCKLSRLKSDAIPTLHLPETLVHDKSKILGQKSIDLTDPMVSNDTTIEFDMLPVLLSSTINYSESLEISSTIQELMPSPYLPFMGNKAVESRAIPCATLITKKVLLPPDQEREFNVLHNDRENRPLNTIAKSSVHRSPDKTEIANKTARPETITTVLIKEEVWLSSDEQEEEEEDNARQGQRE